MTLWRLLAVSALHALPQLASAGPVSVQVFSASDRPLVDAVVYLVSREARVTTRPKQAVEIAQKNRSFIPKVTVVPRGSTVHFPNQDNVRHHVYSFSPVKPFELKLYAGTPANPVMFNKPGIAVLGCNIHDEMVAWVVVVETPYYARTGVDGRVTLDNVPAGTYRLHAWHPDVPTGNPGSDEPVQVGRAPISFNVGLPVATK